MTLSYITFVLCNNFIFKCLFVSVTKVSVHFLICFYLLKVSKTEIFANIFADVISEGSWWRQQQQHLVHSVHYCPIMRHTPWQTCNPCLTKPSCLHILTRKVQQRIPLDNMAFSDCQIILHLSTSCFHKQNKTKCVMYIQQSEKAMFALSKCQHEKLRPRQTSLAGLRHTPSTQAHWHHEERRLRPSISAVFELFEY